MAEKSKPKKPDAGAAREAGRRPRLHAREGGQGWYAEIGGTRYGPMASLDELDEFLPKE